MATKKKVNQDPVEAAKALLHRLLTGQPKLDKHGARIQRSIQQVIDGGDAAKLPDLGGMVDSYLGNGVPEEKISTRRRVKADAVVLTDEDKRAFEDEATARGGAKIAHVKNTADGNYVAVGRVGGDSFVLPRKLDSKEFKEVAVVGKSYDVAKRMADKLIAEAPKSAGHLARGIDGRNSPHSVKSHHDKVVAERKGNKPESKAPKADPKKAARKEERAAKAAPKGDDKRAITIVKKDFAFGREGTSRRTSWDKCMRAKTVAAYIASGGAAKYLPRWVSAGAIKLA